ncbi:Zn-dependent protease with chaperone function [Mycolicibacterium rhodesiae NBB3]|uniref:Zn-dependent protease with chaperone function n=1 Tax=Mycolicibacterium rhodesiae (strain NBB3) TaxID=710685 RepID=G8RWL3_MYCRN|nr:M48 family metallopeptidase [Mycolicibacterium rhodesiae]AEV74321.1 Zn-dependent protease with chaperone function [Mycolicibacterium rhodesiae NBB3]
MNFFDHQRAAKGTTLKLVFLFAAAVVALVAAVDAAAVVAMLYLGSDHNAVDASAIVAVVIVVTAVTLLVIAGGMLFKTLSLRQGGAAVAAAVGAVPVDPTTSDPQLRRLVNIVEEMALASGVPAPRLFVMPREQGINAFAAGFTPADAAIAVTAGALAQLNRDELQGVIGHEFSHILNGDMRLNIRLIGLLAGILLIGMIGLRALQFGGRGSDSKGALPVLAFAFALMVLGFIGVFFANVIKAAVSRQREWLADASAVQFTRQTDGLEGALKKIGGIPSGSRLANSRNAAEVSHMLFGEGARRSFASLFATHPPLLDRVKALNPNFDPSEMAELQQRYAQQAPDGLAEDFALGFAPAGTALGRSLSAPEPSLAESGRRVVSPEQVVARAGTFTPADLKYGAALHAQLPDEVRLLATQPTTAPVAVIALLLAPRGQPLQTSQLSSVAQRLGPAASREAAALADRMAKLPDELRLPFVGLALQQLAAHPRDYQDRLVAALNDLAVADGTVTMFEYCVTRLVWNYLLDAADPARRSKVGNGSLNDVRPVATTLLATLAVASGSDHKAGQRALHHALRRLYGDAATADNPRRLSWQQTLDDGWAAMDALEPKAKQALVEAMVMSVLDDGTVTAAEAELLRAACGLMHVPLPALLA